MELKSLEDWVIEKNFKAVPRHCRRIKFRWAHARISGSSRRSQQTDRLWPESRPGRAATHKQQRQRWRQLHSGRAAADQRTFGRIGRPIPAASQQTVIVTRNGTALRVKDIAVVSQGPKIRLGQFAKAIHREDGSIVRDEIIDNDDVVSGIVLLRKGAAADTALQGIHEKVKELNDHILPPGVKIVPFIDRSDLVHFTSHTVLHNLTEGMILVSIILFLFLGNIRGAFIVAATIPFSLLFASICLDLRHIPANLLSLGALDFGMVVDGAVVMIENIVRHLGQPNGVKTAREKISDAAHEVQRPVFYAIAIIITAYLPIFTLQRVEGRLFHPMAWTVAFALLGALLFSIVIAPVLASFAFQKGASEWHNPVMHFVIQHYRTSVRWAIRHRAITIGACGFMVAVGAYLTFGGAIGSEFLPHLDEGALWVRGTLAPSTGPDEGIRVANQARIVLCSFPEVPQCTSQVGRPDDGTDTTGFFNTEFFVDLKPKEEWRPVFHEDQDDLIAAMNRELDKIPGVVWGFSQPIEDNMEEAVSGVKGALATKIYGDDLKVLEEKSDEIVTIMRGVRGVEDLGIFRVLGQPNLNVKVDRAAAARYQINVSDVQDAVQTAVGGNALTQVLKGEARYDLTLRYLAKYRDTREAIENIRLLSPSGERVSLAQLCKIGETDGASEVYREGNRRYVAIKYSVRGRDAPGGTVEEAIRKVNDRVKLPTGYTLDWEGEYKSQKRANARTTDRATHHHPAHLHHSLYNVQLLQMGAPDSGEHCHRTHRRPAGAADHRHQF